MPDFQLSFKTPATKPRELCALLTLLYELGERPAAPHVVKIETSEAARQFGVRAFVSGAEWQFECSA